ncbi:MAG: hypothetical protein RLZ35_1259 [Pseudomonadota bacterium]|jgi:TM2 domain-containing membrane protein YozV
MSTDQLNLFTQHRKSQKSKSIAFWLCLIFGPLGLHRLYVGRILSGLFMLIASGISFFWGYEKFGTLMNSVTAALSNPNQADQLNQLQSLLNTVNADSSATDTLLSWLTLALLIWAVVDLITIARGKFKDQAGHTL